MNRNKTLRLVTKYYHVEMPYIVYNSHKASLLQVTPKLTARYINDFYKASHNI